MMTLFNQYKPKSEFSRNVLTLMTGTTIAQAIPIAISPILTRIYTPEDFGVFALYISIASIVAVVATGRYELAIMLPKKDDDAIQIVLLSLILSFFVSLIALLIVSIFNSELTKLFGNTEISRWLYFIPISIFLTGMYQSLNYWMNRKKMYKRLATSSVVKSGSTATTNLGLGFSGFGSSGLILGHIVGQSVANSILAKIVYTEDIDKFKSIKKLKIIALVKKYKKFPLLNLPNALIDGLRVTGISILIAKLFTTATLGQFSLAWKMVQTPMSLIGSSLSQVFFQKISTSNKNQLNIIVKKFIIKISIIAFPIFLIIYFFAVDIFSILFGENWKLAGEAASIMAPWLFLNFLSAPMANVFIVLHKQEVVLIVSIFYMLIPISILLLFSHLGFISILNLITFGMSVILILFISLALIYTKKEANNDTK